MARIKQPVSGTNETERKKFHFRCINEGTPENLGYLFF